ncbi:FecR family protein [Carboxylicivirga linearis]|uniref:FecR domain-containing protein n=1 Tax=Carboxylicivirga linearis TaxID=1628157 RepID=A0ABS5JXI9_9BACT|nr:FecR family protein [Carboxylicivirga linearis]MBS2099544.1 FecR domain-containing protein [Carboxylicivirga linearis]
MKKNLPYNNHISDDEFLNSLPEIETSFSKSKEEVWDELSGLMEDKQKITIPPTVTLNRFTFRHRVIYAVAALVVVLLATGVFIRFYTKTVISEMGQQITALLPDGSTIELNAGSTISYHPYYWKWQRHVHFEGEGFFKVQKGKSFEVVSAKGKTMVLGTSFNIYSRKDEYKVTCYTGKVRVVNNSSGQSADIEPNQQAMIDNGHVIKQDKTNTENTISWRDGMFIFTAAPILDVLDEIERQYGVIIKTKEKLNYNYTGNFTRDQSIEDVLHTVCLALNLTYKKVNNGYMVSK